MLHAVLRNAVLASAAATLIVPAFAATHAPKPVAAAAKSHSKAKAKPSGKHGAKTASARKPEPDMSAGPMADFGDAAPSDDVVRVANWVSTNRNNWHLPFVLVDKKQARMYVFDANGKLKSDSTVLLGKARGDDSAPGVGNKKLSQLKDEEKTTPAGRFFVYGGRNAHGSDVLWLDYKNAVSLHRMVNVPNEHRAERMAASDVDDKRISNGCVNVPAGFYNTVLRPTVGKRGLFVYVLPDTKPLHQVFGSLEVRKAKEAA